MICVITCTIFASPLISSNEPLMHRVPNFALTLPEMRSILANAVETEGSDCHFVALVFVVRSLFFLNRARAIACLQSEGTIERRGYSNAEQQCLDLTRKRFDSPRRFLSADCL